MNKKIIKILIIIIIILLIPLAILLYLFNKQNVNETVGWNSNKQVNEPILLSGMTPVKFSENAEEIIEVSKEDDYYNYISQETSTETGGTSQWANSKTKDGSLWVWIPRYAYKINTTEEGKNTIDVVFLKGTSNLNAEGKDVTKLGYKVHPAFQDGTKNKYENGEWNKKLTGIWVAKFEAGFAGIENTATVNNTPITSEVSYKHNGTNVYGEQKEGDKMMYPVFMGKAYTYNNLFIGEMYELSASLTSEGNPYGLSSSSANSHMMKNSEWGATAYLAHSQYGRNATKVTINNINFSIQEDSIIGTVTGYAGNSIDAFQNIINETNTKLTDELQESYAWYTEQGKLASTTGNLYGVYDMNGGASEYTSAYVSGVPDDIKELYVGEFPITKESTPYYTVYKSADEQSQMSNFEYNNSHIGEAINETSEYGKGYNSWNGETSIFPSTSSPFFLRSGDFGRGNFSGIFSYTSHNGHACSYYGFRCVLIPNEYE